jgi:hypothetical protein
MYQRKKRELDPMLKVLNQLGEVEGIAESADVKAFTETIGNIKNLRVRPKKL